MKVVILAGGFGTRIADVDESIPKPLIQVNNKPLIWHILDHYSSFGFNDFYIALGYKSEKIKEYFLNLNNLYSNISINLKTQKIITENKISKNWNINLIDTGIGTLTGGRLKRLKKYIGNERFMLSYGDSISDVDIKKLENFHNKNKKIGTVTAVHPPARFGELKIKNDIVFEFKEKPQINEGWINGGYFVFEPEFFEFLENDKTILERKPLENLAKKKQLVAYKHKGFWHCVDTRRDRDNLEKILKNK
jgi:glucose-1-phosphate cytidylyltransferase